ncbi:MAG TPA: NAD-dependent protein deacylase [Chloroflexi bacterium]|nr:NAD-dependent protein deacylase [Chloroflexota bacterium]
MEREQELEARIREAAALLREARHAIALTGAGISTPSGIPDFRSPGTGLWEKSDPMEVASLSAFRRHPEAFYRWVRPMVDLILSAQPNPAHVALAQLEAAGRLQAVLTQNIDGLHQRAGSQVVLELHGHLRETTCLQCYRIAPAEEAMEAIRRGEVPTCPVCGGVVKPKVILFGEQLPSEVVNLAMEHVWLADLILVVGSSLTVLPAAKMPAYVHSMGGQVIIVNRQRTYADDFAAVVFHEDVVEVLPRLAQACLGDAE